MSHYQILYQIVFATKDREPTIVDAHCTEAYKYIWGILKNKKCKLHRINGMPDHIHLVCDLHPSIALATLVKDVKVASSLWLKGNELFPDFAGWQDRYGAFTYSHADRDKVIEYVKNQKEHHKKENFKDEYKRLLIEHNISFQEEHLL